MKKIMQVMNAHRGQTSDLLRQNWVFEPKLDGVRALCYVDDDARFISRNNIDVTSRYNLPSIRQFIKAKNVVLDGEIVAFNKEGNPSFSALQQGGQAHYVVFDILMKNDLVLTSLPLHERKRILEQTVKDNAFIKKIPYTVHGKKLWQIVIKHNVEGVMAKDFSSHYYQGLRTYVWLKIKRQETADCVIMGYTSGKRIISSLALGLYNSKQDLVYMGKVGTGFDEAMVKDLYKKLTALPEAQYYQEGLDRSITWVKPVYVCEIKYLEVTHEGRFRAPVFTRLREDKKPLQCTFRDNDLPEA